MASTRRNAYPTGVVANSIPMPEKSLKLAQSTASWERLLNTTAPRIPAPRSCKMKLGSQGRPMSIGLRCIRLLPFLWPVLLLPQTVVHYDQSVDFAKFHTYSWAMAGAPDRFWTDELKAAVDRQLAAKGWLRLNTGADVHIVGSSRTSTESDVLGRPRTVETAEGAIITVPPQVELKRKVTLFLDVFDARLTKTIWHVSCIETLSGNTGKTEKLLERAASKALRRIPPGELNFSGR
jgi:Domain of unknown function (DUF4136)